MGERRARTGEASHRQNAQPLAGWQWWQRLVVERQHQDALDATHIKEVEAQLRTVRDHERRNATR